MAQHSAKGAQFQVVTGNTLATGAVVYLSPQGAWVESLKKAAIADGADAAQALLEKASSPETELEVVGIYLFEVVPDSDVYKPASVRETIRALGPTTHPAFAKQANK